MTKLNFFWLVDAITFLAVLAIFKSGAPHYHVDVYYIMFMLVLSIIGFIGAIAVPGIIYQFLIVSAAWIAFYLLNSVKYGFMLEGFTSHLSGLLWLGFCTIPVAAIATAIKRKIGQRRESAT